jgi:sigma-B regulation protein RsbU (phosphoserine phosphatase)
LDQGLAAWVGNHRQIGLSSDTTNDDRWVTASHQAQTIRSALAVPILKGKELLGILSLHHSQPEHFSTEMVEQMQATSDQIALTLENARLYGKLDESYRSLNQSKQEIEAYSKALGEELEKGKQIQRDFLPDQIPALPGQLRDRDCGCFRQGCGGCSVYGADSKLNPRFLRTYQLTRVFQFFG